MTSGAKQTGLVESRFHQYQVSDGAGLKAALSCPRDCCSQLKTHSHMHGKFGGRGKETKDDDHHLMMLHSRRRKEEEEEEDKF